VCEITTNRVLSRARRERRESVLSKGVRERFMIATVVVENGKTCTSVLMLALIPPETVGLLMKPSVGFDLISMTAKRVEIVVSIFKVVIVSCCGKRHTLLERFTRHWQACCVLLERHVSGRFGLNIRRSSAEMRTFVAP
jgi:hypothetical protein